MHYAVYESEAQEAQEEEEEEEEKAYLDCYPSFIRKL
jgi:hypothetical protein